MYEQQQYNGQHGGHGDGRYVVNTGFSCRPIVLDDYNSDLNFVVEADGFTGSCLHRDGFEYLWAGARATHGVSSGKVCFEVVVGEKLPVNMPETERTPHVVRIGWSTDFSTFQVGEDVMSYGYGGTGKCSVNNKFFDYGQPYSTNNVIGCYINFDAKNIFFTKNGHYLAEAFRLGPETQDAVFYPHVTMKNMKVRLNFGLQHPYFPPIPGYTMIQHVHPSLLVRATGSPDTRKDCQVIMMVGIPACGKTFWAEKYAKENKHKKYNIFGTNVIMDRMKVMGLQRQRNYHGRWDALIKQATQILNNILKIAEKKNRNYILDQTNVYPGARKRKIGCFHGFHHIAAVVMNKDEVLQYRTQKREKEEGKLVPEKAVMEMKANFTLPTVGDVFDEVWFIEEDEQSSKRLIEQYNREGREYNEQEQVRKNQPVTLPPTTLPPAMLPPAMLPPDTLPPATLPPATLPPATLPPAMLPPATLPPAAIAGQDSSNTSRENPQIDPRAQWLPNQAGSHGYSSHNARVYHSHELHPYGSHIQREPFNPPDVRPPAGFPSSQENYYSGTVRHNPEREGHNMAGNVHSRYSPYGAHRRYDAYSSHQYQQYQQYNNSREPTYTQPYTQDYQSSYGYNTPEVNTDYYSVQETREGCSSYESLMPGNSRQPVENDYRTCYDGRPPNSEPWYGGASGGRGNQGYSAQHQYNSAPRRY